MSATKLAEQLDNIKLAAVEDWNKHQQSVKSTYKLLSQAYLNWREAIKEPEWLEKEYAKAGIKTKTKDSNRTNFRPYIRLIYDFTEPTNYQNKVASEYSIVMNALDDEYNRDPKIYQSNALGKLIAFIEQSGGIIGLRNEHNSDGKNDEDNEISGKDEKRLTKKKLSDDELANRSVNLLANSKNSIGTAQTGQHVRVDDNNLVALIGRREEDGTITILGTTNEEEAINATAIHATKRNPSLIPYNLRLISEVIHTQMFPRVGMPKTKTQRSAWYKRIWLDKTGYKASVIYNLKKEDIDTATDAYANPRSLQMRNVWEDIIFSALRSQRSVVTQCKPKTFIGDKSKRIYLKVNERGYIENYIENNEIELLDTTPNNSLLKVDDKKYIYKFTVENKYNKTKKDFHFYEHGRLADKEILKRQTEFDFFQYKSFWETNVDVAWFEDLRAGWLDEWFATLGKNTQLKRESNFLIDMHIKQNSIRFTYNMDATGIAPSHKSAAKIEIRNGANELKFQCRSKDIAPILYNLADLAIEGTVVISGNEDAVVFEFNTAVGEYKIAVPIYDKRYANSHTPRGLFYLKGA